MRSIIILTAILLVIFTAVPSSACTWTLIDPYFYGLSLTDDPARYLVTIVTSTNKSDRIELCYDSENRTLGFPGENDRSIGYTDNFKRINTTHDYTLVAEITGSLWIVKDSNGTTIIHAWLPKIVVEERYFFFFFQARIACLVVKDKGDELATAYTAGYGYTRALATEVFWDQYSNGFIWICEQEGLVMASTGCCYCVAYNCYRYSKDRGFEHVSKVMTHDCVIFDSRVKKLVRVDITTLKISITSYHHAYNVTTEETRWSREDVRRIIESRDKDKSTITSTFQFTSSCLISASLATVLISVLRKRKI
ncbi:MAG: hypothetical protein ACTSP4_13145 [Candidatus Hodarchaeales archaeon]